MSRAMDSVISSPELRELILLQLDLQTLLCAQRVCRSWQHTTTSPRLQEALFFRPRAAMPSTKDQQEQQPWEINPLLARHFPSWFAPRGSWKERYELEASAPWTCDAGARERFLRLEASWRRMLPAQPAPVELRVVTKNVVGNSEVRRGRLATGPAATRAGEIRAAKAAIKKSRKKKNRPERKVPCGQRGWNGRDINMGIIYHFTQSYVRERVVSYFCVLWPEATQGQLNAQMRDVTARSRRRSRNEPMPGGSVRASVLDSIGEEAMASGGCLTIMFEKLWNWFEAGDKTGDWLERQNVIFASLSLRYYNGPVLWGKGAVEWEDEKKDQNDPP